MKYLYETHLHTSEVSACAVTNGSDYVAFYKKCGYNGIIVTDHFFNGNSVVDINDNSTDWNTKVDLYCLGYENALAQAKKINEENKNDLPFQVFFGMEFNFNGDEYLIYGITKEWLKNHPDLLTYSHKKLFQEVNKIGGLMIQAHPFRLRSYMASIHIHPREVHGIEVYNAGNNPSENVLAYHFAKIHNLPLTSGSDMHDISSVEMNDSVLGGMEFEKPLENIQDFISLVKAEKCSLKNFSSCAIDFS